MASSIKRTRLESTNVQIIKVELNPQEIATHIPYHSQKRKG